MIKISTFLWRSWNLAKTDGLAVLVNASLLWAKLSLNHCSKSKQELTNEKMAILSVSFTDQSSFEAPLKNLQLSNFFPAFEAVPSGPPKHDLLWQRLSLSTSQYPFWHVLRKKFPITLPLNFVVVLPLEEGELSLQSSIARRHATIKKWGGIQCNRLV